MVNIYLYGKMGRILGEHWKLNVQSPAEALHAININSKNKLREYLLGEGLEREYVITVGSENISKDYLKTPTHEDIHITPKLEGHDEVLQTIIGVTLIIFTAQFWAVPYLMEIGIAMTIAGVSQMLTPKPKKSEDQSGSRTIQGIPRTVRQGSIVPLVYGQIMVEPFPIAVSQDHYDRNGNVNTPPVVDIDGGWEEIN